MSNVQISADDARRAGDCFFRIKYPQGITLPKEYVYVTFRPPQNGEHYVEVGTNVVVVARQTFRAETFRAIVKKVPSREYRFVEITVEQARAMGTEAYWENNYPGHEGALSLCGPTCAFDHRFKYFRREVVNE